MRFKRFIPVGILLLLFGFSLFVRMEAFTQTIPGVPKFVVGYDRHTNSEVFKQVDYVMYVYQHEPISTHWFAPYVGKDSKFPTNRLDTGLYVYTSFSPVMFIVPFLIFTLLHVTIDFTAFQVFSLAIQLITTLLAYLLVKEMLPKRKLSTFVAVLAASVYIFSTNTMQSHMNVYWAHQLLQPFYFATLLFFVKKRGALKWWQAMLISLGLTAITWTGAVVSVGFALYYFALAIRRKDRTALWPGLAMLSGIAVAVAIVASQIMFVTGVNFWQYLHYVRARAEARSIVPIYHITIVDLIGFFVKNVVWDIGGYILLASAMVASLTRWKQWTFNRSVIAITLFPLLESIPLLEHDASYAFGRLKMLVPLILILALSSYAFLLRGNTKRRAIILTICFALAHLVHVFLFLDIYNPTGPGV